MGVASPLNLPLRCGEAVDAAPGQSACGDRVLHRPVASPHPSAGHWLAVIDGLGHGQPAAQAADSAVDALDAALAAARGTPDPWQLLRQLDAALTATRGAAVGLAHVQARPRGALLRHAGVGNTRCLRWRDGQVQRIPSIYGVIGDGRQRHPRDAVQTCELATGDVLLLFTDGLDEGLHLRELPPGWRQDPHLLAQHLLAHWREPRDDAAVLVALI